MERNEEEGSSVEKKEEIENERKENNALLV